MPYSRLATVLSIMALAIAVLWLAYTSLHYAAVQDARALELYLSSNQSRQPLEFQK